MSNSRQQTSQSKQGSNPVERRVINQVYSYNPLVEPPGYSQNTQTASQMPTQMYQQPQMQQQYMMPASQYQPADRNYFEQNLLQINDQMSNINSYNQQAVNHNQMLIEMQENKLNQLMNEVKKLKDGGGQPGMNGKNLNKDKDLENLMMLNAFDDSLANTRLYYGDNLYNQYGRYAKTNFMDSNPLNNFYPSPAPGGGGGMPRRNLSQPFINPEQKFRKQVFGGFGELFWDDKGNKINNQNNFLPQQYNNNYNIPQSLQNIPISAPTQQQPFYQQPPQQQQFMQQPQSVFQRNSSQILNNGSHFQQQMPRSPQVQQMQQKFSPYDIPNRQTQTPLKSTTHSLSALDNQPPNDDPLVNLLIKQGQLMENISSNIDKETKKQEKNDLKRLKKKLDQFEEKQKNLIIQEEYNNMFPNRNIPQKTSYDNRNIFDPMAQFQNLQNQQIFNPMMNQFSLPLQIMLSLANKNNEPQVNKQSRLEQIKASMLMRKLALENELLKQGKQVKSKSKKSKKKRKGKKSKRKNRRANNDDDEEDFDDDFDDEEEEDDYYYDSEDDDWDSDEDYYDDDDEEFDQEEAPPEPKVETEEEKKKREEEELKKQKEERRKYLIKRLRLVKTRAMFPVLYFGTIRMQILEKKAQAYKKMNEDIASLYDFTTQWVQKVSSRGLNLIADVKASCDITKKLSDKELKKRVDNLKLRVKALLDGLADNCKEEDIGNVAIQIFGQYTNNFNFPPQQFLYKFEINRLKYTYFGALKNLKVIQSVIYEILIEYLRSSCPPIQNNQSMLSAEKKIKEIPKIPAATNDPVDPLVYKDAQKNDEPVVLGLFARSQLEQVFEGVENSTWLETMKSTLQGLGESLVQTINKKYEEMRAKIREENKANKKNISSLLSINLEDKDFLKKAREQENKDIR